MNATKKETARPEAKATRAPREPTWKRRARALADALGPVVGSSSTVDEEREELAFALHVEADGGARALLVAGAARRDALVVLEAPGARAFAGLVIAKTIALEVPRGREDALDVTVPLERGTARARLVPAPDLAATAGAKRVFRAKLVAANVPTPGDDAHAKLLRSLERLARLRELDAPEEIVANEEALARAARAALVATGWDPAKKPLPARLAELCDALGAAGA